MRALGRACGGYRSALVDDPSIWRLRRVHSNRGRIICLRNRGAESDRSTNQSRCRRVARWSSLEDAGNYVTKLPKAEHEAPEWQAVMETLMLVATLGGPTMFARIGVMRALNRHAMSRVADSLA
jgi:hypothetical protein